MVSSSGAPSSGKDGRLEIYFGKEWGTVCNTGFTKMEAEVSCGLMGYVSGNIIGTPNEVGACETYND